MIIAHLFACFAFTHALGMEPIQQTKRPLQVLFTTIEAQADTLLKSLENAEPELITKTKLHEIAESCSIEATNHQQIQDLLNILLKSKAIHTQLPLVALAQSVDIALFEALVEHDKKDTHTFGSTKKGPGNISICKSRASYVTGIALSPNGKRHASLYKYSNGKILLCIGQDTKIYGISQNDALMATPYFTHNGACIIATKHGLTRLSYDLLTALFDGKKTPKPELFNSGLTADHTHNPYGQIFEISKDTFALQISDEHLLVQNQEISKIIDLVDPSIVTSDGLGTICTVPLEGSPFIYTIDCSQWTTHSRLDFKKTITNPTQVILKTIEPGISYIVLCGGISNKKIELIIVDRSASSVLLQQTYELPDRQSIKKIYWPDFDEKPLVITDILNKTYSISTKPFRYLALLAANQQLCSKKQKEALSE